MIISVPIYRVQTLIIYFGFWPGQSVLTCHISHSFHNISQYWASSVWWSGAHTFNSHCILTKPTAFFLYCKNTYYMSLCWHALYFSTVRSHVSFIYNALPKQILPSLTLLLGIIVSINFHKTFALCSFISFTFSYDSSFFYESWKGKDQGLFQWNL